MTFPWKPKKHEDSELIYNLKQFKIKMVHFLPLWNLEMKPMEGEPHSLSNRHVLIYVWIDSMLHLWGKDRVNLHLKLLLVTPTVGPIRNLIPTSFQFRIFFNKYFWYTCFLPWIVLRAKDTVLNWHRVCPPRISELPKSLKRKLKIQIPRSRVGPQSSQVIVMQMVLHSTT